MEKRELEIAEALCKENEEFRREMETHRRYEAILEQFNRRAHLTADEEMERKKIQKLKLAGKDRMARMISAYEARNRNLTGGNRP